jgi:hypothetical protein
MNPHTLCLGLLIAGLAACSSTPDYDQRFGDATRVLAQQQRIDPDAAQHHAGQTPPTDGRTVRESMARQLDSFRAPPQPQAITLGVGVGGASQ